MTIYDIDHVPNLFLFHTIARGIAVANGTVVYEKNIHSWPTMCGGRILAVEPVNLTAHRPCVPTIDRWDRAELSPFPCSDSGLLAINMIIPADWYEWMYTSIHRWVDDINAYYPNDKRASVDVLGDSASPGAGLHERNIPVGHKRLLAIVSVEDMNAHDYHDTPDHWDCEECGDTVYDCDDGYCEDCGWYTGNPENYPSDDEDLSGNPMEDYEEHYNYAKAVDDVRPWGDSGGSEWLPDEWDVKDGVRGTCLINVQARMNNAIPADHSLDLDRLDRKQIAPVMVKSNGVAYISSNIAEPHYHTPYLMSQLLVNKDMLWERYGIRLLHNDEHFATNPNERSHWIDGIILIGIGNALIRRAADEGRTL